MTLSIREAAAARSAAVLAPADRPAQRRCSPDPLSGRWTTVPAQVELRAAAAGGDRLHFTGAASVYERGYEMWDAWGPYTEVVSAGAASDLARVDLDVPLVLGHDSLRRIARTTNGTLTLSQGDLGNGDLGLIADAPELDLRDADVAYIAPKIESGLITEMSFMFRIESGRWSPDYEEYRIDRFTIHRGDVSIVGYGANPWTGEHTDLRSAPAASLRRPIDSWDTDLRAAR